jgi:superfamily I DNA and/or RNA helicase
MLKQIDSIKEFHSLLDYYTSCLEKEELLSLTFNYRLEGKKFHSTVFKKEQFFLSKKEQFEIKKTPEIETIFNNYKKFQQNIPLFYGYPLVIDSTGAVSPLFFVEIFYEEKKNSITITKESINPEFNHYILAKDNNIEEINKIRSEISEEDNFNIKLEKIIKLLKLDEKIISSDLEIEKPLMVTTNSQLINKAILYSGGRTGFTKGVIEELQKLKRFPSHNLKSTALGCLFDKENRIIPWKDKGILEVFNLNNSQEKSVINSLSNKISVITGPPGTGKSQVVLNILANAVWHNKTVLFASKNNRAVDVVNDKLKSILSEDLIIRMGSNKHRRNAKLQINKIFQNKNLIKSSPNYNNNILKFDKLTKKINKLKLDINTVTSLNENIESIHKDINTLEGSTNHKLSRYYQGDKYNFLRNLDIKADINSCKKLDSELKNITLNLESFSNDIISLNDQYIKPKPLFTHLKNIKNNNQKNIQRDIEIMELDNSIKNKIYNKLTDLKKEKNRIIEFEDVPTSIIHDLGNYNFESINDFKLKRNLAIFSKKENFLEIIIHKLFPFFSLNIKYKIFNDVLKNLDNELITYFSENTEFNASSIFNSLNLILVIKKLSYMTKKEEKYNLELNKLNNNIKKIVKSYFSYSYNDNFNNIIGNLNYIIYLNKKFLLENEIKRYKKIEYTKRNKRKQIFNKYYSNLSEKPRDYYDSIIKKHKFMNNDFLDQMLIQEEIRINYSKIKEKTRILLNSYDSIYELKIKIETFQKEKIIISKNLFENCWFEKLKNTSPSDENNVSRYIDASEKLEKYIADYNLWKKLVGEQEDNLEEILSFLPIWVVTNLSAKNSLPLKENLFDILIIDEASQCDIASALPLFYRAKQVVIIGDPKQLKHISLLKENQDKKIASENNLSKLYLDYAYSKNSLYDISERIIKNKENLPILLNNHYRSHEDIINFSNKYFYEKKLNILTDTSKLIQDNLYPFGIKWVDVKGKTSQTKSPYNQEEANEIIKILKKYKKSKSKNISFGIVTIFRAQMELIIALINKSPELRNMDITVGTTHRFQGDEKDIIIFSPAISSGIKQTTLNWINSTSQLLNVAITRAKSVLIIVGDKKKCHETKGILGKLVEYTKIKKQAVFNFDSPIEEKLFRRLIKEKIKVIPQYETKVRRTKSYRLDFALFINNNKYDIEVDGDKSHSQKIESDILRDVHLRLEGWKIRRFSANELNNDLNNVIKEIKRFC